MWKRRRSLKTLEVQEVEVEVVASLRLRRATATDRGFPRLRWLSHCDWGRRLLGSPLRLRCATSWVSTRLRLTTSPGSTSHPLRDCGCPRSLEPLHFAIATAPPRHCLDDGWLEAEVPIRDRGDPFHTWGPLATAESGYRHRDRDCGCCCFCCRLGLELLPPPKLPLSSKQQTSTKKPTRKLHNT